LGCGRPEKEIVGASNAAAVTSSVLTVLEVFWGENPPLANKKDQNALSDSYPYPERGILPNTKNKEGGEGGSPPPTHNFACSLLSSSPKQQKKFGTRSFDLVVAQRQ
jgi:hypothetical protein